MVQDAAAGDILATAELAARRRQAYAAHQPVFRLEARGARTATPKARFLDSLGFAVATEWHVRSLR